jgi:hypothetical protein
MCEERARHEHFPHACCPSRRAASQLARLTSLAKGRASPSQGAALAGAAAGSPPLVGTPPHPVMCETLRRFPPEWHGPFTSLSLPLDMSLSVALRQKACPSAAWSDAQAGEQEGAREPVDRGGGHGPFTSLSLPLDMSLSVALRQKAWISRRNT